MSKVFFGFRHKQELYCVRSDLGNLLKALGRLEEAKVGLSADKRWIVWGQNKTRHLQGLCTLNNYAHANGFLFVYLCESSE